MCGFVGVFSPESPVDPEWLEAAANSIRHRGPDDAGVYIDQTVGFGMAHRRLAILDLSPRGHQPMVSSTGRYVIAYNGEIYNHLEIRRALLQERESLLFKGTSDTETLLAAIEIWGIQKALSQLNGMFAFALWDSRDKRLCLARDRMGEKPLYVGWVGRSIHFGSELKPFLRAYNLPLNSGAIPLFLSLGYIPAPWSILRGMFKLPPAHYLWLHVNDCHASVAVSEFTSKLRCYWSLPDKASDGITARRNDSRRNEDIIGELEGLLKRAVEQRMIADVPLGMCLSGGIDSSLIAALMQASSSRPIKTFTVGFKEAAYDESHFARRVAAHLGTDHTEMVLGPQDALNLIPQLSSVYDEPFADSSQIPTLLVSKMLKLHVTVALSGDGGDELFFGYDRYRIAPKLWSWYGRCPIRLRRWLAGQVSQKYVKNYRFWRLGQRLSAPDFDAFYLAFGSVLPNPEIFLAGTPPVWELLSQLPNCPMGRMDRMMYRDQTQYLPDDILVKVDRASMSVSLEMRAPFLDHHVVEWAWSLPSTYNYRNNKGKWMLRQVLGQYLPNSMFDRPKQGFAVPLDGWLRGPLCDWAENLLSSQVVGLCPGFSYDAVNRIWRQHQQGNINAGYLLWNMLMLLAWFEKWRP